MRKPTRTIPTAIQSLADLAVANRRGWSGGMTMTAAPPESTPPAPPAPPAPTPPAPTDQPVEATDEQGRGLGFPKETPTERMKPEEQAAYWRNQSRTQEKARRTWEQTFAGKKPEEVQAALDELATKNMTEQEQAIEKARKEGIEQGRQAGGSMSTEETAMLLLESILEHRVDEGRRKTLLTTVDLSKVAGEDGKVDPVKVRAVADALAPAGTVGPGNRDQARRTTDLGGGRRGGSQGSGVAAGRDLFAERRGGQKQGDE